VLVFRFLIRSTNDDDAGRAEETVLELEATAGDAEDGAFRVGRGGLRGDGDV
jgi:hypothetical protein